MNSISKLTLSAEELQLVNNSHWILTKRIIVDKVYHVFGNLSDTIRTTLENENGWLPPAVIQSTGKISKGENYRLLPYALLDHPRCFDGENFFAIRTMFWWGNFFSMTLQLSGTYKKMVEEKICSNIELLKQNEFHLCINEDQWQHHFEEDNYLAVKQFSNKEFENKIQQMPFVKLAVKFPLQKWDEMPALLEKSFFTILKLLKP